MPPGAILNLDDPYVGIETHFARETLLDLGLGGRQFTKASDEQPVCGTCIVEGALRRWSEQLGGPVKPIELDKYGSGLLGAAPADGRERAFDMAAADIGGNPDCRFEAHSKILAGPAPRTHTGDPVSTTRANKTRLCTRILCRGWVACRKPTDACVRTAEFS